jgi:hypothetical protein
MKWYLPGNYDGEALACWAFHDGRAYLLLVWLPPSSSSMALPSWKALPPYVIEACYLGNGSKHLIHVQLPLH